MKQAWPGFLGLMLISVLRGHGQPTHPNFLMPQPSEMTYGPGNLILDSTFAVQFTGAADLRLREAVGRTVRRVEQATGLSHEGPGVLARTPLVVRVAAPGETIQGIDEVESYRLLVTSTGIQLDAPTDVGALRGLETLVQLVVPSGAGYAIPAVTISDAPRFRWRGLMLDCGRHFEPVSVIERTLDGMAAVKLNVFHWHLTEDQGFRMQSVIYPKLTSLGSDGLFYTQDQARGVVAYARARGIRVVPEFEMPGHSAAWLVAYPELASGTVPKGIRREFGVSDTAIDPTQEQTYVFIGKFLAEMAAIFPDEYVHIGGDESPAPDWQKNPRITAFMKAHNLGSNDALQAYFNTRVLAILTGLHKRMVGWDEVLTPSLPKDVVVQSWRGVASLNKGARMGYQGVLSAPYYLDGMKPAGVHYLADPLPLGNGLTGEQQKLILGGEVCMWAEHLNARTIDSRIWPRTAAIAERFWSPATVTDVDDMYRRLETVSIELEGLGLTHLQSGDAALRELAGTDKIDSLRVLASAMEPVSFGERYKAQRTDQLTALDRFVDAVRPDPPARQWVENAVKRFVASPASASSDAGELSTWFERLSLAAQNQDLRIQMAQSPRLRDAAPRVDQIPPLAGAASEALQFLANHQKASAGWKARQMALIAEARKPSGLVRFVFLDSLATLINAVPE